MWRYQREWELWSIGVSLGEWHTKVIHMVILKAPNLDCSFCTYVCKLWAPDHSSGSWQRIYKIYKVWLKEGVQHPRQEFMPIEYRRIWTHREKIPRHLLEGKRTDYGRFRFIYWYVKDHPKVQTLQWSGLSGELKPVKTFMLICICVYMRTHGEWWWRDRREREKKRVVDCLAFFAILASFLLFWWTQSISFQKQLR